VSETWFEELCRYVRFGDEDGAALRALHPHAHPWFERIATTFYQRIQEHEDSVQVLRSPDQVDRLKVSLVDWLDSLLAGPWDEAYFQRRTRIGRMHVQVKLPQRFMFGAIAVIRGQLQDIAHEALAGDPEALARTRRAIDRILDLELGIMLESYGEETVDRVQLRQRGERDRLERELEASEARYHEIIEGAEILIIGVDGDGRFSLFNRRAEETTGRSRIEVLGQPVHDVISHAAAIEPARAALAACLAGEPPPPFEAPLVGRHDEERTIRWHVAALPGEGSSGACAFGLDVTETRRLEKAGRRAERLATLGTLAAGLAHEIRNPLNSAHLQLTLVERRMARGDDPDSRARASEAVHVVQQELRRLGVMVEDFLAFARPRPLRLRGGDLRDTTRQVVGLIAPEAEKAGVSLEFTSGDVVAARYDAEQIKQVLHNLLRNAVEAAGRGGSVGVAVARQGHNAQLVISDSGAGPPDDIDIFAPFTTTKDGGTGLGLPIVHRIISDHGGEIMVEHRGGRTSFSVELPLDGPPTPSERLSG